MSKKQSNPAPKNAVKPDPPPAPPVRKEIGKIYYRCPYCGSEIAESFNTLPMDWVCYKCTGLYSIVVLPDELAKELRKFGG